MRTLPRSTGDVSIVDIQEQVPLRDMSDMRTRGLCLQAELFQADAAWAVSTCLRSSECKRRWAVCPIMSTIYQQFLTRAPAARRQGIKRQQLIAQPAGGGQIKWRHQTIRSEPSCLGRARSGRRWGAGGCPVSALP